MIMMGGLAKRIKKDNGIIGPGYSRKFLLELAEVLEKGGFIRCRVFLLSQNRPEVKGLIKLLDILEGYPGVDKNPALAALIIKSIKGIKMMKLRELQQRLERYRALGFVGKGTDSKTDVALYHDDYLSGLRS